MSQLSDINAQAHRQFLHPNKLVWDDLNSAEELAFLSEALCGQPGEEERAIAYLYKELAQLAEIEFHVAAVMLAVMGEAQSTRNASDWDGFALVNALSCFAAEETQHASSFYAYVRRLSGKDLKPRNNFYHERIAVYQGDEAPLVKLAALCATAYVGESVITVFERRLKALDPAMKRRFTQVLHLHGLDEARHVQLDHYVFDHVVPRFDATETRAMRALIESTETLNTALARTMGQQCTEEFGVDFTRNNIGAATQLAITKGFQQAILADSSIRHIDEHMDRDTRKLVSEFSFSSVVHA